MIYSDTLKRVDQVKYLGRIVSFDDNDTPAVHRNIKHAWKVWGKFCRVLDKEEVPPSVEGIFYQAIVASILLYGSKT